MNTLEVLQNARAIIAPEGNWVQNWGEVDAGGRAVTCAMGAVRVALGHDVEDCSCLDCCRRNGSKYAENREALDGAVDALSSVIGREGEGSIIEYNDENDHACVIAMFDAAIEREEAKHAAA